MHIYIDNTVLFELLARLRNKSMTDRMNIYWRPSNNNITSSKKSVTRFDDLMLHFTVASLSISPPLSLSLAE